MHDLNPKMTTTTPKPIYCVRCNESFDKLEYMAKTGDEQYWHMRCFVCSQCFKPFSPKNQYYKFEGRMYCERDFRTLFAPCCSRCDRYIVGRFIKAMNKTYHANCFVCESCNIPLADEGFNKLCNRALCHACYAHEKSASLKRHLCNKCNLFLEPDELPLRLDNETYHAYHFNCHSCGIELRHDARKLEGNLYCLRCHDKSEVAICGSCRRPIEERVVTALGKRWHVEHFVCATCERPFNGKRHFEVKGSAYCEEHYYSQFGRKCFTCDCIIKGADIVCALDKFYCVHHFACYYCGHELVANKTRFFDVSTNPCCKSCYRQIPASTRNELAEEKKLQRKAKENDLSL